MKDSNEGDARHSVVMSASMRVWKMVTFVITVLLFGLMNSQPAVAQVAGTAVIDQGREYNVKAVSLYAFSRLTVWPKSAFQAPDSDLVIGVFGTSRIESPLNAIAMKKTVGNRKLQIIHCKRAEDAGRCHLVFVSDTIEFDQQLAILKAIEKRPVFVVGETRGFGAAGGVANFYISGTNVKFELNQDSAEAKSLKLNAKLLSLGTAVKSATAEASEKTIR